MTTTLRYLPHLLIVILMGSLLWQFSKSAQPISASDPSVTADIAAFDDPEPIPAPAPVPEPEVQEATWDILGGQRNFTPEMLNGVLTFRGVAFAYPGRDAPTSGTQWGYVFDGTQFTSIDAAANEGLAYRLGGTTDDALTVVGPAPTGCIDPQVELTSPSMNLPMQTQILCHLGTNTPDGAQAIVGYLHPDASVLPLEQNAGDLCRYHAREWQQLPEFEQAEIILCAIVEATEDTFPDQPDRWMDVIVFQPRGSALSRLAAASRNR